MKNYMNEGNSKFLRSIILGMCFGFVSMVILTLFFSFIVASASTSWKVINTFSVVIIGVSALVCGFSSAKINKEKILLVGTASGAALYFLIGVIAIIITKDAFSSTFLIRMLIAVVASVIGSILSVFLGKKNKYI